MGSSLEGRNIVVTGSGRGIGAEIAKLIGLQGGNVIVNDPGVNVDGSGTDNAPAEEVAQEIRAAGGNAIANFDTVATAEGGENMITQCVDEFGRIDGIVHVAGILRDRMILNMTEEEWDDHDLDNVEIESKAENWPEPPTHFPDESPPPIPKDLLDDSREEE